MDFEQATTLVSRGQAITVTSAFQIFGHRGSPKRLPENTISSFEETLRAGADGFETDLRLLSDGTPVLFHDDELREAAVESLTLEECSTRGASMERVADLGRFAGRATMILEVKRSRWEAKLLETIRGWPNVVIASFDHRVVTALRGRGVDLGITVFGSIINLGGYAQSIGATWCFPNYRFVDEEMVGSLRARRIRCVPWTPNRENEWERLRELGCDGIITDYPAEAVEWRRAHP